MAIPDDSDRIALRAYQIWEREGCPQGRDQEHWQQAQKELEVEFRIGFPDATGDEDPDSYLSSSDSERAISRRKQSAKADGAAPASRRG